MAGHGPVNSINPIWADHWTRGPRFEWNRKAQRSSPDTGFQKAAPPQQPRAAARPTSNRENAHPPRAADNSETLSDTGFSSSDDEKKAVFRHYTEKSEKKHRDTTDNAAAAFCNRRMSHASRDAEREHRSRNKTLSPEREAPTGPDRDSWYRAWANAGSASAAQQVGKKTSHRSHSCTSPEPAANLPAAPQPVNRQNHVPLKSVNERTAFEFHDSRRKHSPTKSNDPPRHSPDGFPRVSPEGSVRTEDPCRAPPPRQFFEPKVHAAAPQPRGEGQRSAAESAARRHEAAWQAAGSAASQAPRPAPETYARAPRDPPPHEDTAASEEDRDKWFEASAHFHQPNYRRRNSTPSNNHAGSMFSSCSSSGSTFSQRQNGAPEATSPVRKNRQSPSPERRAPQASRPRSHTATDMRSNRGSEAQKKKDEGVKVNTGVGSSHGSRPKAFDFKSHWAEVEKDSPEEKEDDKKNREKIYEWAKSRLERVRKGDSVPASSLPKKTTQFSQWEKYDNAFTSFTQNAPECIRMEDIPWPDDRKTNDVLQQYLKSIEKSESRKELIRALSLRWHPDKFVQTFGQRLLVSDKDKIMQRVTVIFQLINSK